MTINFAAVQFPMREYAICLRRILFLCLVLLPFSSLRETTAQVAGKFCLSAIEGNIVYSGFQTLLAHDMKGLAEWNPAFRDLIHWKYAGIAAGSFLLSEIADKEIAGLFSRNVDSRFFKELDRIESFAVYLIPASLAGITAGIIFGKSRFEGVCYSIVEGSLISWGIATLGKSVIGRARPSFLHENHIYRPFRKGFTSMPSGHTMQAFSTAAIISRYYPRLSVYSYCLATCVSMQRLSSNSHWLTDIVLGICIGNSIGKKVVDSHFQIHPRSFDNESRGLNLRIFF